MTKKTILTVVLILVGIAGLMFLSKFWSQGIKNSQTKKLETSGDLISIEGIHWHPELTITIKGEKQPIPAGIGIGMQYAGYPRFDPMMGMTDMHTHDDSGTLHFEVMKGPVKKDDVRIGTFFKVWGKTFNKDCIFEYCNNTDGTVKMFVNGKENTEFENYLVNDKDKIEIRYESR